MKDPNDTTQLPHVKQDDRPQRGLWCPGDYWCTCTTCKEHFWGDKRAQVCADCSYDGRTCGTCGNRERAGLSSPCLVCFEYCNYVEEDECTTE